jgi:hypothetical protein
MISLYELSKIFEIVACCVYICNFPKQCHWKQAINPLHSWELAYLVGARVKCFLQKKYEKHNVTMVAIEREQF